MQTMTAMTTDRPSRSHTSRLLRAQFEVASTLATSREIKDAGPSVLATICSHTGWVLGELWRVDDGGEWLRCEARWCSASVEPRRFPDVTYGLGRGLPGAVWQHGGSLAIADIRVTPDFDHRRLAATMDVRSAFALAIECNGRRVGVMIFFGRDVGSPSDDLRCLLDAIGFELGVFLSRQEAEEDRRRLREALVERERLAAIGRTAASLGHEIANPLSGMFMAGQLMQRRLDALPEPDPKIVANLARMVAETRRLVGLLEDFRSLWRRNTG